MGKASSSRPNVELWWGLVKPFSSLPAPMKT